MPITLSPEITVALKALATIPGVALAKKITMRKGLLCVANYGRTEIQLMQSAPGDLVLIVLEKLKAKPDFSVAIGGTIHRYGFIEQHKVDTISISVPFYSLPGGAYAGEFVQAFSSEDARAGLVAMYELGWVIALTSQQIEIVMLPNKSESEIFSCVSTVLKVTTQTPFMAR